MQVGMKGAWLRIYSALPLSILLLSGSISTSVLAESSGKSIMSSESGCHMTPLKKSQAMIRAMLDDLTANYHDVGGGGISGIKQVATNSFLVSINQEERIDQIAYELEFDAKQCKVKIVDRKISAVVPTGQ